MAGQERAFIASPIATAGGRVIASPFQFYATGEDRLRIVSANSLAGVRVTLRWRFIDSKGLVQANGQDHVPNSNRTTKTDDVELGVGALLNLTVFASSGAPKVGQTFVIVQLVRGIGAAAIVLGTLLAGYVTSTQHLAWPGSPITLSTEGQGFIRTFQGTDPAAGVEIAETVPTGARWKLLGFAAQFTTDATAVNRTPSFGALAGAFGTGLYYSGVLQGATSVVVYTWATGGDTSGAAGGSAASATFGDDYMLLAGTVIRTVTGNLQAGDDWTLPAVTVREWLEVD